MDSGLTPAERRRALAARLGIDVDMVARPTVELVPADEPADRAAEIRAETVRQVEAATGRTVDSVDTESFPIPGGKREIIWFRFRR